MAGRRVETKRKYETAIGCKSGKTPSTNFYVTRT